MGGWSKSLAEESANPDAVAVGVVVTSAPEFVCIFAFAFVVVLALLFMFIFAFALLFMFIFAFVFELVIGCTLD